MVQTAEQFAQFIQRSLVFFREFKEHAGVRNLGIEFFLTFKRLL
jgi:hypothetical protein